LADRIAARSLPVAQAPLQAPLLHDGTVVLASTGQRAQWHASTVSNDGWRPASFTRDLERLINPTKQASKIPQILLLEQLYQRDQRRLSLFVRHYLSQQPGRELVTSGNRLLSAEQRQWRLVSSQTYHVALVDQAWTVQETVIKNAQHTQLVWSWYRIGRWHTANHYWAKLLEVYYQLSFGPRAVSHIVLALDVEGEPLDYITKAQAELASFVQQALPALTRNLDHVSQPETHL